MSDSDSDLDFESADEDTIEHDTSEKENSSETKDLRENAPDLTTPTGTIDVTSLAISTEKEDITVGESDSIKSSKSGIDDTLTKQSIAKMDIEKADVDVSLPKPELKEVDKPKRETQRVPLRLEKKIQQKSQISKESAVEKSDPKEPSTDSSKEKSDYLEEASSPNIADTSKEKSSSWGFSSWGTSLLSTAASSVSTFSSQVSQGIGTVLETVESTLGAPSPEELASVLKEKRDENSDASNVEKESNEEEASSGILPDVSVWTKVFENTGSKVIMGGLDTLELIGKKTMDILTEGDPGLRNKRHVFADGVTLSQILREAKDDADAHGENNGSQNSDVINYSQVFDDQQGLVHLEALEMLSKQTQAKFQRLLMRHSKKAEVKKKLEEIKSICENIPSLEDPSECEGFEDFESVFRKHVLELSLPLNVDNIVKTQRQLNDTVSKYENQSEEPYIAPDEIFRSSICSLAEFTARCIETFHKVAELVLVQPNLGPDTEQCATNLTGLTTVMCIEINNLSSRYHKCLDSSAEHFPNYSNSQNLNITAMVTNLYVEASNSNKYIQDAFQMLVPVLQVCLLENLDE